ncbi:DUF1642 domain-containing protein [Enterococcus hirae]|uniref:DUF1642 domain-containing protein n=1 Tax=Enterococcus hirae TaxID=1354 RepID=UPI001598CFF7|nr:DUF1642 domain-containing protein [Enterococcus hirae]QKX66508.1 DUF1642 domain-containing protein [Enterococcus hirae]
MNKQEAIKELESYKMIGTDARSACYNKAIKAGILVIKKLDEPQKPVVDSFVAEWFEDNKDALDLAIFMAIRELDDEEWPHKTDFENWLDVAENKPIETLIHMKDGYEVEKEPLYEVIIGNLFLVKKFNNKNDSCFVNKFELCWWEKSAYQLTEPEIKAIDERYWAFAVPVEEVAEG